MNQETSSTSQGFDLASLEDSIPESFRPIFKQIVEYQRQIIAGVIACLLIVAAVTGYNTWQSHAMEQAEAQLGDLLVNTPQAEKLAALEAFLPQVPSDMAPSVLFELADAATLAGDYDKAAGYWAELSATADEGVRMVAGLGQAASLMQAGKPAEALAKLEELAAIAPEAYTVAVNRMLAQAAEEAGDNARAVAALEEVMAGSPNEQMLTQSEIARLSGQQ